MSDPMGVGTADVAATPAEAEFRQRLEAMVADSKDTVQVCEVGTLRSDPEFPTRHTAWAPAANWVGVDVAAGTDVDVVADAHKLTAKLGRGTFDAYVGVAVWEHLARPWVAMAEAARLLRPGGLLYVATHQTFPLHGYPSDYFRFSTEAMRVLCTDAGLEVLAVGYAYRCTIVPPPEVVRWNTAPDVEAWLNVEVAAYRP